MIIELPAFIYNTKLKLNPNSFITVQLIYNYSKAQSDVFRKVPDTYLKKCVQSSFGSRIGSAAE